MKNFYRGILTVILCFSLSMPVLNAAGADYTGAKVTQLKKSTRAANGQQLEYSRTDKPEVTALIVEIPPGGNTGWHYHPVPVYAFMLSGSLTVETEEGKHYDFQEGDVIFEMINTPHNGKNGGTRPAKLVVFYTGAEGTPNTVPVKGK